MRKISYKLAAGFMAAALAFTGVPFVSGLFDTGTVLAAENSDADTQKTYSFGYGESETTGRRSCPSGIFIHHQS